MPETTANSHELKQHSVLPGFGLTMGFTLLYLSLIVLIPLGRPVPEVGHAPLGASSGATVTDPRWWRRTG